MKRVFVLRFCLIALASLSVLATGCFRDPAEAEVDSESGSSTVEGDDTRTGGGEDTGKTDTDVTDTLSEDSGTRTETDDTGADCTCFIEDACCDGCLPRNEGGACSDEGAACTEDVCRSGKCQHKLEEGYCLIEGECHRHNNENPENECQYCDLLVSSSEWTDQMTGEGCDDGDPCTLNDHCNAGVCRGEEVACADGDSCCPSACGVDEDQDCCDLAACMLEPDGCVPSSCGFAQDADVPCASEDDVRQPGTTLCWRRCPLGQTWTGGSCSGTQMFVDWCDASGESGGDCTSAYPGQGMCSTIGGDYWLPSRDEYAVLFETGGCSGNTENVCTEMFGADAGVYWTSTTNENYESAVEVAEMGRGTFDLGHQFEDENGGPGAGAAVRCVKAGP